MVRFLKYMGFALILVVLFGIQASSSEIGTTADLYRLYGIRNIPTPEEEAAILDKIYDNYISVATKVAEYDMISIGTQEQLRQQHELLKSLDEELYVLADRLKESEENVIASGKYPVAEILRLDAQHRNILSEYESKLKQREVLMEQVSSINLENGDIEPERERLKGLSKDLEEQQKNYEKSLSYSKLGQVGNNKYPLIGHTQITSSFGWRLDPIEKDEMQFHQGADMTASLGTTVLAQFNGTVEEVKETINGGLTIVINHGDGVRTVYLHLSKFLVEKGEKVVQYQPIALSGNSGKRTTGPHLHFGLYIGGQAVDPALLYK